VIISFILLSLAAARVNHQKVEIEEADKKSPLPSLSPGMVFPGEEERSSGEGEDVIDRATPGIIKCHCQQTRIITFNRTERRGRERDRERERERRERERERERERDRERERERCPRRRVVKRDWCRFQKLRRVEKKR